MEIYNSFASVYDMFMQNVPYKKWADFIESEWQKNGEKPQLVLDLSCGTGSLAVILAKRGYEMIGIDASQEMLMAAKTKSEKKNTDILFLNQEMQSFELYGTVDAIICTCDSINYLESAQDLLAVFKLCMNYLNNQGTFIFDINSQYKYEKLLSDKTFCETLDGAAFICENQYDKKSRNHEYFTTFFVLDESTGQYTRFEESHMEHFFSIDEIKQAAALLGFSFVAEYPDYTAGPIKPNTDRITIVLKKNLGDTE